MPISVETIIEDQQISVTLEQEPVDIDTNFKTEEGKFLTTLLIAHLFQFDYNWMVTANIQITE